MKKVPKKIMLSLYSNTSTWEMKQIIGKYIECAPDNMKATLDGKDIKESENGKSLSELKIKGKAIISITQKSYDDIPKAPLMDDKNFTPKGEQVFREIFSRFSTNGLMNPA